MQLPLRVLHARERRARACPRRAAHRRGDRPLRAHRGAGGHPRVRLTGGEPLVSHRIVPLIEEIRSISEIEDVPSPPTVPCCRAWRPTCAQRAGKRVNISLDTLDPARFSQNHAPRPRRAGARRYRCRALEYGFTPVKVNTVVVRRMDQDVLDLARLSVDRPVHVRFIEYMPIGGGRSASAEDPSSGHGLDPHCGAGAAGIGGALNPDLWDASDVGSPPPSFASASSFRSCRRGPRRTRTRAKRRSPWSGPRALLGLPQRGRHRRVHLGHVQPFLRVVQPPAPHRRRNDSPLPVLRCRVSRTRGPAFRR